MSDSDDGEPGEGAEARLPPPEAAEHAGLHQAGRGCGAAEESRPSLVPEREV